MLPNKQSSSLIIFFALLMFTSFGQDTKKKDQKYLITMEGKPVVEFMAEIIKGTQDSIWLKVNDEIKVLHVESIRDIQAYTSQFLTPQSINRSRHILAPTARGIYEGDIYYQNLGIAASNFTYGMTDNFSTTVGIFVPALFDLYAPLYIAPKFSFEISPKFNFGFGAITGVLIDVYDFDFDVDDAFIVPYLNATFGGKENNLTLGVGVGRADEELDEQLIAGMLGFMIKIKERVDIVSESTFINHTRRFGHRDNIFLGAHCVRLTRKKNIFDVGLMTLGISSDLYPLPYLGYVRAM